MTASEEHGIGDQQKLSVDEVSRRFPGLEKIGDAGVREGVIELTRTAPKYFWEAPAASPDSEYHHPRCREKHGLWAHTLMLIPIVDRLADSLIQQRDKRFSEFERDSALAAAYLHDQRKRGPPGDPAASSVSDHDKLMARVIRIESDLPDHVSLAVASHMGPWYDGPEPASELQDLVHTADMLASTAEVTPAIPEPVPRELEE